MVQESYASGSYKALIIAVDRYKQGTPLPNTLNDAMELKKLLIEEPTEFSSENVHYIHGNLATKTVLEAYLMSYFNEAMKDDVLFLFWAGHGNEINGEGYFIPYNADSDPSSLIPMKSVKEMIETTKAETVLSFFDTCKSGTITRNTTDMLSRGIEVQGAGKILIAACLPHQFAHDRSGHGAFTDYLLRGLRGEAADSSGNIDIYNLYSYISNQLKKEYSDSSQIPLMKSTVTGTPIHLKRVTQRKGTELPHKVNHYKVVSSGSSFYLGSLVMNYQEYKETDSEIRLLLKDITSVDAKEIRTMRNTQQIFAIHNDANIVDVKSIEMKVMDVEFHCTIVLQSIPRTTKNPLDNCTYQMNGKTITDIDIAEMRMDRLIGIVPAQSSDVNGFSFIESMVLNPPHAPMHLKVGLLNKLIENGLTLEQVRIVLVSSLIFTHSLDNIESVEFTVENHHLTGVKITGYRPKYYDNAPPKRVEYERIVSIPLKEK